MSAKIVLALAPAFIAILYSFYNEKNDETLQKMKKIIISWDGIIKIPDKQFSVVALGTNVNVDLVVRAVPLLQALNVSSGSQQDHPSLATASHLQETFHHFFTRGAAAERFYSDAEGFRAIVDVAKTLQHHEWSVGGNAALMAKKIAQDFTHIQVELVGPVGPKLQELLPSSIHIPSPSLCADDEVHLIMEYGAGERWGVTVAPQATRFITSSDEANSRMSHMGAFFSGLKDAQPDLVVLSGLSQLDGNPGWREILSQLERNLQLVPSGCPLHLELASMADAIIMREIIDQILPKASSIGLNEQELEFFSSSAGGPHQDLNKDGTPELHKVTRILAWILHKYGASSSNPDSLLSRIHLHSLTFHVIASLPTRWSNHKSAVAAGARVAGLQACDIDAMSAELFKLPFPDTYLHISDNGFADASLNASDPVVEYSVSGIEFTFSPVLVCLNPLKTVGLGDAISATALMYSQYHQR